jgi:hypothetical protein
VTIWATISFSRWILFHGGSISAAPVSRRISYRLQVTKGTTWVWVCTWNVLRYLFNILELITLFRQYGVLTTDWTTEFDPRQRQIIFSRASVSRPALRSTNPPIQWESGIGGSFPQGKTRPGSDAGHSPQPAPRSRMSYIYIHSFTGATVQDGPWSP